MVSAICPQCGQCPVQAMFGGLCPACLLREGTHYEYTIVTVLGRGEHGMIYLAEQQPTHCLVTLKVLNEVSDGDALVERLQRQRHALATLAHPNAARCLDVGLTADRRPYVIREYVRGAPITVHCERSQSDRSTKQRFLASAFDVIAQAHGRGITHGGLKPSNVFIVNRRGESMVTVMDFGVRRAVPTDDAAALERLTASLW